MGRQTAPDIPEVAVAKTNAWTSIVVALISAVVTLATTVYIQDHNRPSTEPTAAQKAAPLPSELNIAPQLVYLIDEQRPWLRAIGRALEVEGGEREKRPFVVVVGVTESVGPSPSFTAALPESPYQVNGYFFLKEDAEAPQELVRPLDLTGRQVHVPAIRDKARILFVLRVTGPSELLQINHIKTIDFKVIQ